jgi:drug/metabolite transporter (DMT)-like permease
MMNAAAKNPRRALVFGLLAVLAWSTVATAFKLALRHLDQFQLLFLANVFSLICLFSVILVQGKLGEFRRLSRPQVLLNCGLGLINPFVYYLVLFKAYDLLPAQVAQPLNFTWALTLSWLSVPILGHRLGWRDLVAGAVCYAGVVIISTRGSLSGWAGSDPLGVALALGSTVIWALYWLGNTRSTADPVAGLTVGFAFSLPFVTAATFLFSTFQFGWQGCLGGLYVGAFEMGFTFVLWLSALRLTDNTSRIANLIFLAPFLSLIFINFVLGETVVPATFVGLVFIVGGLLFQNRQKKEKAT